MARQVFSMDASLCGANSGGRRVQGSSARHGAYGESGVAVTRGQGGGLSRRAGLVHLTSPAFLTPPLQSQPDHAAWSHQIVNSVSPLPYRRTPVGRLAAFAGERGSFPRGGRARLREGSRHHNARIARLHRGGADPRPAPRRAPKAPARRNPRMNSDHSNEMRTAR